MKNFVSHFVLRSVCTNFASEMIEKRESIFKYAARCGLPMGGYLSLMSVSMIFSDKLPLLSLVVLVMLIFTPVLIYKLLRARYVADSCTTDFSSLWMIGILTFIYGSLICTAVTYALLEWMRPDFFYDMAQLVIDQYKTMPAAKEMVDTLRTIVDKGLLPSTLEFLFQMFWLTSFLGSLVSAIVAVIVRKIKPKP